MYLKARQTIGLIIAVSLAATMEEVPSDARFTLEALGLAAGVAALSLLAFAALVGTRSKPVETLFGGLEQRYVTHKWLGIWALGLAAFHFLFAGAAGGSPAVPIVDWPPRLTRLAGPASLAGLLAVALLVLHRRVPYGLRHRGHKLSGPLLLIAIVHGLSIPSPIALSEPAGIWLATASALGIAGAGFQLIVYPWLAEHRGYRVVRTSDAARFELEPNRDPLPFAPGQFGFLRVQEDGLRQAHPFTVDPDRTAGGRLRVAVSTLGGHTRHLVARTATGMHVEVYGPYGPFERRPAAREVWIALSHGIAPFLAWLDDEAGGGFENVTLVYVSATIRALPIAEALRNLATARGAAFVTVPIEMASAEIARHCAEASKWAPAGAIAVSYSGPPALLDEVRRGLRVAGIPDDRLRSETFELGY